MTTGMPELGSKISLISKADIRYEGRLYTVDPNECTIALSQVRSFGTEDRETQFPIAPQSQVYDYILFRGTDIKDIRVVNNVTIPNDPAIMQMHLPPNQMVQSGFQPQGFGGPMGHLGGPPQMGQFGPYGGLGNMGVSLTGSNMGGPNSGSGVKPKQSELNNVIPQDSTAEHKDQGVLASVLDLIGGGSRSTTPVSLLSRKSPTTDMAVQTNQGSSNSANNQRDGGNNRRMNNNHQQQRRDSNPRERHDSGRMEQNNQLQDTNRYRNPRPNQMYLNHNQGQNHNNQGGQNQQNRGWMRPGNNNNNNMNHMNRGGRPRGGGRNGPPQGFRQGVPVQPKQGTRAKNTLKFENDYDFEQANSKFEELRSQLSKLKVGEEAKPEQKLVVQVNGEVDKKDDSGNETGAGEQEQEDDENCYDKTKSFFDNISCEAVERSKGKTQRTDWRQERKLNSETFGVSSTRRGGFRPRGGYYNRGPMHFRGGYRNNNNFHMNNRLGNHQQNHRNNGQNSGSLPQRNQQPSSQQASAAPATAAAVVAAAK